MPDSDVAPDPPLPPEDPALPDDRTQAVGARETVDAPPLPDEQRRRIGRYKLLEQLGEGGFGTVWMAEQREPVKRRVALKIIKLGMDTKQVIARFEAERQALAMMDHPHIAKVFDAGTTETGRPYFVMELVRGIPIVEYCDKEKLDTRARIALFQQVCQAIQHAHQKGIIHRDIKPSNVLVGSHDGVPAPKVIDFGIAKATNQELTQKTLFTEHRQVIGTPAYMAPEQADSLSLDVDTRADIYSLGVLLYELLTGTTPFDTEELRSRGFAEMMRIIREEEPHKPSTRLSSLGDEAEPTAKRRRSDVRRLGVLLRGELDWIVMKCLEKDRTRRYESAHALAADLGRHLSDEPVLAGPPSRTYRLRKFARRHRGSMAVSALLLFGLIAAFFVVNDARRDAIAARNQAVEEQRRADEARQISERLAESEAEARRETERAEEIAQEEAAAAREVSRFLLGLFDESDPIALAGRTFGPSRTERNEVTARTIVDRGAEELQKMLLDQPAVRARLLNKIGSIYIHLGVPEQAAPLLEEAFAIREQLFDPEGVGVIHEDLIESRESLAILARTRGELCIDQFRAVIAMRKEHFGNDHRSVADSTLQLALYLASEWEPDEAERLAREAIDLLTPHDGVESLSVAIAKFCIGQAMIEREEFVPAAVTILEAANTIDRLSGDTRFGDTMKTFMSAQAKQGIGLAEAAKKDYLRAIEMATDLFGEDHFMVSGIRLQYAHLVFGPIDDKEEAVRLYREVLREYERIYGKSGRQVVSPVLQLARSLRDSERPEEAIPFARRAVAVSEKHNVRENIVTSSHVLCALIRETAPHEAEDLMRRAVPISVEVNGFESGRTQGMLAHLASLILAKDDDMVPDANAVFSIAEVLSEERSFTLARLWARAAVGVRRGGAFEGEPEEVTAERNARLSGWLGDQAMTALVGAIAAGFDDAAALRSHRDLDVLRERPTFGALLEELEAAGSE